MITINELELLSIIHELRASPDRCCPTSDLIDIIESTADALEALIKKDFTREELVNELYALNSKRFKKESE